MGAEKGVREVQFLPLHDFGAFSPEISAAKLQHRPVRANSRMLEALRMGTCVGVRVRPFPLMPPFEDAAARDFAAAVEENLESTADADLYQADQGALAEHPANTPGHKCHLAWSECFVGVDGTLTPCDMYIEKLAVGNLYDATFRELWNAPKMQELRRTVNSETPAGLCRSGVCMFRPETGAPELTAPRG